MSSIDAAFGRMIAVAAPAPVVSSSSRRATISRRNGLGVPVTQQYIVGELSALLAGLQATPDEWLSRVVRSLRREVEISPPAMLPQLAREATNLTEMLCWVALELGDVSGFCRHAETASALRDFTISAGLRP
jgi:hypothetical protein